MFSIPAAPSSIQQPLNPTTQPHPSITVNIHPPLLQTPHLTSPHLPSPPTTTTTKTMTSKPPPTIQAKRGPSTNTLPTSRPPTTIHPSAIIADKAQLTGTHRITVHEKAVIHPYARLRAERGPITIGACCSISERATIGHSTPAPASATPAGSASDNDSGDENAVELGQGVNVEGGAEVLAAQVGDWSEVGVGVKIGEGAVVGKYCKITALNGVSAGERVEDYTVVYGEGRRRRDGSVAENRVMREAKAKGQEMQFETVRKLIPSAAAKFASS